LGNKIGRITPAGAITEFPIPTSAANPWGIAAGPDGNLWFTEMTRDRIGQITPAGVITEFPIPTSGYSTWHITTGPDGNLWFTRASLVTGHMGEDGRIGQMTPAGMMITEFPVPTYSSNPNGIAVGPDGHLWFAERLGNRIGRLIIPVATDFYTLTPCRVFDTRELSGPTLGSPLTCGTERSFTIVGGTCGVPASARAISLNLTGTASTAPGNLRLFAPGAPVPLVSNLNYASGQTRGNNAVAPLSASGQISVLCSPSGTTHVIMDLNGYLQ
jgi:hypothetical protein